MDIFVVDDEAVIVETLATILRGHGYSVRAFRGAHAVLDALHLRPKLLITDYRMPGLSGTDLVVAVRRHLPGCPAILFSAELEECHDDWLQAAMGCTPTTLIRKPLHPMELLRHVRGLVTPAIERLVPAG